MIGLGVASLASTIVWIQFGHNADAFLLRTVVVCIRTTRRLRTSGEHGSFAMPDRVRAPSHRSYGPRFFSLQPKHGIHNMKCHKPARAAASPSRRVSRAWTRWGLGRTGGTSLWLELAVTHGCLAPGEPGGEPCVRHHTSARGQPQPSFAGPQVLDPSAAVRAAALPRRERPARHA